MDRNHQAHEASGTVIHELMVRNDEYLAIASAEANARFQHNIQKDLVHFYFALDASAIFEFSPQYSRELTQGKSYFIYDPTRDYPVTLHLSKGCRLVMLFISIENMHHLFIHDSHEVSFLKSESITRKFYEERETTSNLHIVLNNLFRPLQNDSLPKLFYHGKVMEILSFYFSNQLPEESCPYLSNEKMIGKLKQAKDFILEHIDSPPSLKEVARVAGLNQQQLKAGFKKVFGNTVYNYLMDHRMEQARILLDSGKYHVKEVSYRVGYTNTSHFISYFRRKYGVTPKKYLMGRFR
ncbi:MAG: helix-turn-helix transcriptional regulator [Cyclobacteriaceae bacterium]|nr:helix-turn-helix transcriptional regulator [Cyclobacteriaceae bacterium]